MKDFYEAWTFLENHEIFKKSFNECLDISVIKVNEKTKIHLETGPYDSTFKTHYQDIECEANTFEEAIITVAKLVKEKHGDKLLK